jgi:hypothetical protein
VGATVGQAPAKKASRVSLHESQNITHHFSPEGHGAAEQRLPSILDVLQAQKQEASRACAGDEVKLAETEVNNHAERSKDDTHPGEACARAIGAENVGPRAVEGVSQLDFEAAAAVTTMPSMMDMLQLGMAASLGCCRHNSDLELDDATNEVLSQMLDDSRITINTPPLDFFAAAGAPSSSPYVPPCYPPL